jgi:hypothetical protein
MMEQRMQAIEAINQAAEKTGKPEAQYTMGMQVWLEGKNLKLPYQSTKLAPKRYGPFKIIKEISPVAYQLRLPMTWGIHDIFHSLLLLPYQETTQHRPNFLRPPLELIKDEEEYKVEAICNHQCFRHSCTLQYLVKWRGYPESNNTWEPADNVHTPDLLKEYHRKHIKAGQLLARVILSLRHPGAPQPICYGFSSVWSGPGQVTTTSGLLSLLMPTHFISSRMYHFHLDRLAAYEGHNPSSSQPFHPFLDGSAVECLRVTSCTPTVHS